MSERRRPRRMVRLKLGLVGAIAIRCVLASWADAAPAAGTSTVVLESHVGQRSTELAATLEPLLDELARHGLAVRGDAIAKRFGGPVPRPGTIDDGLAAGDAVHRVERGLDAFANGDFQDAEATLTEAVRDLRRNPAATTGDPASTGAMFNALVGLALTQKRLGRTAESVATMTELVRAFPAQAVSRAQFGPEAEQLYRTAQAQARSIGHGRLSIVTRDEEVQIFIDGQRRGAGKLSLNDLLPGTYSVYAQAPGGRGRQYEVPVRANEDSVVEIDWPIDSVLTVSGSWAGFVFRNATERAKQMAYAATLARRWSCDTVVVVGMDQVQGAPAVSATLLDAGGEVIRRGLVLAREADDRKLRSLARYILDGTPSSEVTVATKPEAPVAPAGGRSSLVSKLLVGGGLAALAAGVVLIAVDQDPGHKDSQGNQTPSYWQTAPFGIASGVIGLAAAGAGVWLLLRTEHGSSIPVVSLGRSSGVIGWRGSF